MINLPSLPTDLYGLFAVLIILIGQIVANRVQSRRIDARLDEKIDPVHEQVANDHPTNLRDDIDSVVEGFAAGLVAIRGDLTKLSDQVRENHTLTQTVGDEVREDRKTRRDEDKALDERRKVADKAIVDRLDSTDALLAAALTWAKTVTAENHPQSPMPPDGL